MNGTTRVVAYLRRSTKDQANSLSRQKSEIERYVKEKGVEILRWYEDDGISGTEDALRPGFCAMIADAERHEFDLILVHELSRFGRFDAYRSGSWLHRLTNARVRVQAIEGVVKDPYSIQSKLMIALEQDRQESVKLSFRSLSGQRELATKGFRVAGRCPFGFARRRRRVDGTVESVGRVGTAKRDKSEVVTLVPGDAVEVEAVQSMFKMARDGVGLRTIAEYLNDLSIPSPDFTRRRTMVSVPGRWTQGTVRALLQNVAYAGDAVWNKRSSPRFHRLEGDKIVQLDDFEQNQFRKNPRADWVVVREAHPALVDRATFDAVQQRFHSRPSLPRGHLREYLLTGLITCVHCGDVMVGTTRTRKKMVGGAEKTYSDPLYTCSATLRATGRCRQVALPRDGFERAVLRIVDEELLRPEALARLEQHLRLQVARRSAGGADDGIPALERRELDLTNQVAEGARRLLQVEPSLVPDVKAALAELKDELQRVQASLESRRHATNLAADGERMVQETVDAFRTMASVLRDPTFPLERRREVLRRLLPKRDGVRPILVYIDPNAGRGWRKALKRVVVRHLTTRDARDDGRSVGKSVSPAVAAEAGQPGPPGWEPFGDLATWERALGVEDLEAEPALLGV